MSKTEALVVEVDDPRNRDLHFRPLGQRVRGTFDASRAARFNVDAARLMTEYPQPIPGQRIGLAGDEGFILEPLHGEQHAAIREKLEKKGFGLGPERQEG